MKLRRGFHKEAEEISMHFREDLGLRASDAICAKTLAGHLCISLTPISSLEFSTEVKRRLLGVGGGSTKYFATTLAPNGVPQILYNDLVSDVRQQSDIAHEISHIVLGHPLERVLSTDGCANRNSVIEREAHELGYAILVPKLSALIAVERFSSLYEAASHFGVSVDLLTYRIRKTDARRWAKNRATRNHARKVR